MPEPEDAYRVSREHSSMPGRAKSIALRRTNRFIQALVVTSIASYTVTCRFVPSKAAALGTVSWAEGPGVVDVALLPDGQM
jgi:hypothetical protein